MQMIVRNPTQGIYPATSDYVHAMEVREPKRLLYVAGTMGLDESGVAGKDLSEQLDFIWRNIRIILAFKEPEESGPLIMVAVVLVVDLR